MKCFMTRQECMYEDDIQKIVNDKSKKSLFMVSPFGYPYDEIFQNIIEPAGRRAGIGVWRADRAFQLGFVMCTKICKLMRQATWVVADLTEDNPNVFYELGLAWGFGRKIVVLRDTEEESVSNCLREILGEPSEGQLSYKELQEMRGRLLRKEPAKLVETLEAKAIDVQKKPNMKRNRAPGAYMRDKRICMCYRDKRLDAKFYLGMVEEAATEVAEKETRKNEAKNNEARDREGRDQEIRDRETPENDASSRRWDSELVPIGPEKLSDFLPERFSSSKVVIVDVTHYDKKPDPSVYFALGLSHAMGRETIPITNRARCRTISPFDVRGLWQVYFDNLEQLKTGLVGMLDVISPEYETERQNYPLRFIWDQVLSRNAGLRVISCARGAKSDKDRAGGRTHVDKWDYTSVAELAGFLGKEYKQAMVDIRPPEEKAKMRPDDETGKRKWEEKILKRLQDKRDNIVIVGSPDVNDYAELALARIYGVPAYQPQPCKRPDDDPLRERCWECDKPDNSLCIGQRGYLFYKGTVEKDNPRKTSGFFRDPPKSEGECVLWYGSRYGCTYGPILGTDEGKTFGVLTIFKDRKEFLAPGDDTDRWIILLSGFTGVATYILAQVLTTLKVTTKEGDMFLQEALEEKGLDLEKGVQVLVSVEYTSDMGNQNYDSRNPKVFKIRDIRPLPTGKNGPSKESPQGPGPINSFPVSPVGRPVRRSSRRRPPRPS